MESEVLCGGQLPCIEGKDMAQTRYLAMFWLHFGIEVTCRFKFGRSFGDFWTHWGAKRSLGITIGALTGGWGRLGMILGSPRRARWPLWSHLCSQGVHFTPSRLPFWHFFEPFVESGRCSENMLFIVF